MDLQEINKEREKNNALEKKLSTAEATLKRLDRALEIETALEKVRARTITMRKSSELSESSAVLFNQLKELGINAIRSGVGIFDDQDAMELWLTTVSDSQEVIRILDYFSLHIHPVFESIISARKQSKPFIVTRLVGQAIREYYQTMSTYVSQTGHSDFHNEEFFYSFFFEQGALNIVTRKELDEEACGILIRFAQVFGLIYTRFLDLQKAEMQTREAKRQHALDRVRAEIASMRTADDLQRITPLIWQELKTLGVPFFRCGIFIVDETAGMVHSFLSTPEGKSFAVLHLPFDGAETTRNIVANWRLKKVYRENWNRQQFQEWVQSMIAQGQVSEAQQYQVGAAPPESLNLQCIPFTQGMLYVGSHEPLEMEQIDLVQSLADSFSVAYARYDDFRQLEIVKNRIEATLADLKAAQAQLIQSEKMASLGELTAGIAHEIQNPLNFVNNFSEVSAELIEELKGERYKAEGERNVKLEDEILNDLAGNLEKVTHHGRRASAIVKGMLQHSRSSSGVSEPTDINALCDEYLRLSFHGYRAKEKKFDVRYETNFDLALHKINVVPQDIGRVILNLINNAFYAAPLPPQRGFRDSNYKHEPTVWVSTKRENGWILISIRDNGPGIPQKVLDKIFQPFFTTKPTGQGTGLGLSLSYDIVKAHGGEITVTTQEGEGSEFVIQLPIV